MEFYEVLASDRKNFTVRFSNVPLDLYISGYTRGPYLQSSILHSLNPKRIAIL